MHTEHLFIRPITLDDAEAYWPLVSLPEVLRYTGEKPQSSLDDVRHILATRPLRDYEVYGFGRMACIEKSSGRVVGFSGLKYLEDLRDVDIGYRFLPDCWGKGYATESARALMDHGAIEHGIVRIVGLVQPGNIASARVLEKIGLIFEREVKPEDCESALKLYATPGTGPGDSFKPRPLRGSA
jgi:RimJ/RimL family protein N-acetyltransferase